jgi:hypothetical protein
MDVKCEDILGPWINLGDDDAAFTGERRKDFALLSYSFNSEHRHATVQIENGMIGHY